MAWAINDSSKHFQTELYSGAGSGQTVTFSGNSNLQSDLLWIKRRNVGYGHNLFDTSRGIAKLLESQSTVSENTNQTWISAVGSDSFTIGVNEHNLSNSGGTYVAWAWKANGGTTSSDTSGSITSTVQANTTAGQSIVLYTGTGTAATIGHGLGIAPKFYIIKNRNNSGNTNWVVYHDGLTSNAYNVLLNTGIAESNSVGYWNSTSPTSSVFSVKGGSDDVNNSTGNNYVAYLWTEIQGFSKFGSFIGNGDANGPFVYTGFQPGWIMWTNIDNTSNWYMYDSKRNTYNGATNYLTPGTVAAEASNGGLMHFHSNGFKVLNTGSDMNVAGETTIYVAFAENPFVTSTGVPTTAR